MSTGVVLLAAGAGRRIGGKKPKQFLSLNGEPLFLKSLRTFLSLSSVKDVVVVCPKGETQSVSRRIKRLKSRARLHAVEGGSFRGASVRNGVKAMPVQANIILIHDAARPLMTKETALRVESAARKFGAALAAWPLSDTLKSSNNNTVKKTIPRSGLWLAQTPQGFRRDVALKCLLKPSQAATDDVELAQRKGFKVRIVEGSAHNMKVTYPADLALCRLLAQ